MNKHIITLAGDIASGKGTVAAILNRKLEYTVYKNGEYFRQLAREHNMSVKEFNIYVEQHKEIDLQIEKSAGEYAAKHDNLIIDARLGWYSVPHSFKVYLKVELEESARRILNDEKRGTVEQYESLKQAIQEIKERYRLENERFLQLYHIKKEDMANYDFVLDTTHITPDETAEEIIQAYTKWLKEQA